MKRRMFLKTSFLSTLAGILIPSPSFGNRDCDLTSSDILGPYWSENHPHRTILANSDEPGTRIFISGKVKENDCETPISNVLVDVWHANDQGCYTVFQDCESGNSNEDSYNLRGLMTTDENGNYSFESVWPGYYAGRPRHFHYKVTTPSGLELVTQCYFEIDPYIDEQWEENHLGLVIPLEETEFGLVGIFDIIINEETPTVLVDQESKKSIRESVLHPAFPNPFNNKVQIKFTLMDSENIGISIYDISGKWVCTLLSQHMSSGTHILDWNGSDMNGSLVSSGTYIVIMKNKDYVKTQKIKLIK